MTITSGFMDPGSYDAAKFAEFVLAIMGDGYRHGYLNALAVSAQTPNIMAVNVATGGALIQGCWVKSDAVTALTIDTAHATLDRIDRIVVRKDATTDITIAVLKGTAAASPAAPALTQVAGGTWEISLAQVLVTHAITEISGNALTLITDERLTSYCGPAGAKLGLFYVDTSGNINGGGTHRITNLLNPINAQDAATKEYADSVSTEIGDIAFSAIAKNSSYWLEFSDTPVSRTTYAALFSAIGTIFGAGDGSTTFNLPSPGQVPVAHKSGDANFGTLGAKVGEATHALTEAENGAHTHVIGLYETGGAETQPVFTRGQAAESPTLTTQSSGSGTGHNNIQPSQVFRGFIRYA